MSTAETEYLLRRTEPWLAKLLAQFQTEMNTEEHALQRAELVCDMARIRRALSKEALPHRHD